MGFNVILQPLDEDLGKRKKAWCVKCVQCFCRQNWLETSSNFFCISKCLDPLHLLFLFVKKWTGLT
jgi:hypothetical protein